MQLLGVDFSCAPTRRKPITVARGRLDGSVLRLDGADEILTLPAFDAFLATPGPWFGAFDFPFGLPRAFVDSLALGSTAADVIAEVHRRCPTRMAFRALIDAWGNARPAGQRLIHRATDGAMPGITSSSPLQTRYVPVGLMYYEGFSRIVRAGVGVPRRVAGDSASGASGASGAPGERTAVEGYPGLLAFQLIGRRSYKNSVLADRLAARHDIVDALEQGCTPLGLRLALTPAQRQVLVVDASGDRLDAVLCLMQAGWASTRPHGGMPADADAVEGWIATIEPVAATAAVSAAAGARAGAGAGAAAAAAGAGAGAAAAATTAQVPSAPAGIQARAPVPEAAPPACT